MSISFGVSINITFNKVVYQPVTESANNFDMGVSFECLDNLEIEFL